MLRYIRTVRLDLVVQRDAQKQIQWSVYVQQKRPHCRSEEDEPDSTIGLLASWLMLQTPGGNMIPTLSFPPTFSQPRCKLKKKKNVENILILFICALSLSVFLSLSLLLFVYIFCISRSTVLFDWWDIWVEDTYLPRHLRFAPWVCDLNLLIFWSDPKWRWPSKFGAAHPLMVYFDCESFFDNSLRTKIFLQKINYGVLHVKIFKGLKKKNYQIQVKKITVKVCRQRINSSKLL